MTTSTIIYNSTGSDEIFTYKSYLEKYNKNNKYNIKELVLKNIGVDLNFKINSIQDISDLQFKYIKRFPYNNIDLLNGNLNIYDLDYIVKTLFIENNGSVCMIHNLIFGILLYQFIKSNSIISSDGIGGSDGGDGFTGITNVQRIKTNPYNKSISKQYEFLGYHFANVITFNGKDYFIEVSLVERVPYPIELNSEIGKPFKNTNKLTRVIKSLDKGDCEDDGFVYQEKKKNVGDYISFFQFSKRKTTFKEAELMINIFVDKYKPFLKVFIKFDYGSFYYDRASIDQFKIMHSNIIDNNNNNFNKIEILHIIDNNHLIQLFNKYFNINLNLNNLITIDKKQHLLHQQHQIEKTVSKL